MRSLCLDFDGVLHDYHGWKGEDSFDGPIPGALQFCQEMVSAGYQLYVLSVRPAIKVQQWLMQYGFPATAVDRKPRSDLYIDDNGFRFQGDWERVKAGISKAPWWQKSLGVSALTLPLRTDRLYKARNIEDAVLRKLEQDWQRACLKKIG